MPIKPFMFFLTGAVWLLLSALAGMGLFLGMILGVSLPGPLRIVHVHAALVGGITQMIIGGYLSFVPPLLLTGGSRSDSHPVLYLTINGATVLLLIAFTQGHTTVIGVAGGLILAAFLSVGTDAIRQSRRSLNAPPLTLWFYGTAVLMLLIGLSIGIAMGLRRLPINIVGQARLAHIHLNLLGFVTLTIVGTMHTLFPTVLGAPLFSGRLARWTFVILPAGMLTLVAGFLLGSVPVEIAGGVVMLAGSTIYAVNIIRTWTAAGRPRGISTEHLLFATLFLVGAVGLGLLVTINYLWQPPVIGLGRLHLVAYTHLALIGFIVQTIMGALSHLLPINLALVRVKSNKKRGPYLDELKAIMERGRDAQVGAISLGAMGLMLVGALVWQFNLTDLPVQGAAWVTGLLLVLGFGLFVIKAVAAVARQPAD